jgi:hypothetical protein
VRAFVGVARHVDPELAQNQILPFLAYQGRGNLPKSFGIEVGEGLILGIAVIELPSICQTDYATNCAAPYGAISPPLPMKRSRTRVLPAWSAIDHSPPRRMPSRSARLCYRAGGGGGTECTQGRPGPVRHLCLAVRPECRALFRGRVMPCLVLDDTLAFRW